MFALQTQAVHFTEPTAQIVQIIRSTVVQSFLLCRVLLTDIFEVGNILSLLITYNKPQYSLT